MNNGNMIGPIRKNVVFMRRSRWALSWACAKVKGVDTLRLEDELQSVGSRVEDLEKIRARDTSRVPHPLQKTKPQRAGHPRKRQSLLRTTSDP